MVEDPTVADLRAEIATLRAKNQRLTHALANQSTEAHMMERERVAAEQLSRSMISEQQRQINLLTLQNSQLAQRLGHVDAENNFLREEMALSARATATPSLSAAAMTSPRFVARQEQTPVYPDEVRRRDASRPGL